MSKLQEEFDRGTGDLILPPGEYEGPLTVNRPCTIDGSMSTLWAGCGPVLVINAPGVTVKNLRVEIIGTLADGPAGTAIQTDDPHTRLQQVEVHGAVTGLAGEAENWQVPRVIALGAFAAGTENTFSFELDAPADAVLTHKMKEIEITPQQLRRGKNTVLVKTGSMRDNMILYGELLLQTSVTRRIYLTGKAQQDAPEHHAQPPVTGELPVSEPLQVEPPQEVIAPAVEDAKVPVLRRGQRVSAKEMETGTLKIAYDQRGVKEPIEMDGYVFLLAGNGKVQKDSDLVFFGNPESEEQAVRICAAGDAPLVLAELAKVPAWVERIAVCYSIYGDDPRQNFSLVREPAIRIFHGEAELYRFPLAELEAEKTVVAAEIYRYKGEWKMNFVGAGYHSGLRQLCEGYGVEVE